MDDALIEKLMDSSLRADEIISSGWETVRALENSIRERKDVAIAEINAAREEHVEVMKEVFGQLRLEDLYDFDTFAFISKEAHFGGWGGGHHELERLSAGDLYLRYSGHQMERYQYGEENPTTALTFTVSIEQNYDAAKLERTAEVMEHLYAAGSRLLDTYYFDVMEYELSRYESYKVTKEDGQWVLQGSYHDVYSSDSLVEVLDYISKHHWYDY